MQRLGLDQRSAEEPRLPRLHPTSRRAATRLPLPSTPVTSAAPPASPTSRRTPLIPRSSGQVPAEYQRELEGAALELQNGVNRTAEPKKERRTKTRTRRRKKKGHDKDDGITLETTTEED